VTKNWNNFGLATKEVKLRTASNIHMCIHYTVQGLDGYQTKTQDQTRSTYRNMGQLTDQNLQG